MAKKTSTIPIQRRAETNISYDEMSNFVKNGLKDVKFKNTKEYIKNYYEKQKDYWKTSDPEKLSG